MVDTANIEKVVFIGFRGAGKTTIARTLAARLEWDYLSTDDWIQEQIRCSISQFVKKRGWDAFRTLERRVIQQLSERREVILDCGGGVVENPENMKRLIRNAFVIWVDADVRDILARLKESGDRPLLNRRCLEDDVRVNYRRRRPLYARYGHLRVDTSVDHLEAILETILKALGQ